jgi:HD-GYP domain-containing protein (c-di-GMP phosphodiesterase class II)
MEKKTEVIHYRVTPRYKRYLEFIAADQGISPASLINKFIFEETYTVMDKQASLKAHEELAINSGIPFDSVSWVRGAHTKDWQNLAQAIGEEKALEYQKKFLPIWSRILHEIDESKGLDYFDLERRYELSDEE